MQPTFTWIEVLQDVWWVGVVALLASLVATPIVRALAYRFKIVDKPDDLLKPHARPIAYLGGVGIFVGLTIGLLVFALSWPKSSEYWQQLTAALGQWDHASLRVNPLWNLVGIWAGSLVIMLVGLFDDLFDITPKQKILGQVIAAGLLLLGGVGDRMAEVVLTYLPWVSPVWLSVLASGMMCFVLVVCTCNATNLLDGLDGLAGGVTGIIAVGFLALAVWLAMWNHFPGSDQLRVCLCLAIGGAVLGFLPYNVPPASIFMGDAGSMLLGFFVATMMAMFCREGTLRWLLAAMVVFALPILDTGLAVVRRLVSHKPIFTGDRSHLYDQLVDRGMTVRQVVGLFYVFAAMVAFIGVVVAIVLPGRWATLIYAVLFAGIWCIFALMGMIAPDKSDDGAKD